MKDNAASGNTGWGLNLGTGTGWHNNSLNNNTGGTATGGVLMNFNICDGDGNCP